MRQTLKSLAQQLANGQTTSRTLVEQYLARIANPQGEGSRVFRWVQAEAALAEASHQDALRRQDLCPSPYAGIAICVKDNMDLLGHPTRAGSVVLNDAPPAKADAPLITRLKAAGFIVLGQTHMSEFAYSGVGLNPHHGTAANPFKREIGLIPGGSSSGAAVAVSDRMAAAAIGTDTGGSCRIPAALCGVVGYKPSAAHISRQGVLPLSTTLDSVGPLAMSVDCCEILYSIMSGRTIEPRSTDETRPLRLFVPQSLASLDTDQAVADDFERALMRLQADGVHIERGALAALDSVPALHANGSFSAYESWHWHAQRQGLELSRYDPRVRSRIDLGRHITPGQYQELHRLRRQFIADIAQSLTGFDLLAMPTTPIVAPAISALADEPAYTRFNRLMLRNPGAVNLFDGSSISLPMHRPGHAPTGFMLAGRNNDDQALLHHARRVERLLNQQDRASLAD